MNFLDDDYSEYLLEFAAKVERPINIRLLKLQEEVGEAAEAFVAYLGFKPNTQATILDIGVELADVVFTALVAMVDLGLTPNDMLAVQMARAKAKYPEVSE